MRIQRKRISSCDSFEESSLASVQGGQSAISAINVKPQAELFRDVGNLIQRIDCAGVHCPRAADNAEWSQIIFQIIFKRIAEGCHIHSQTIVSRNQVNVIATDTKH